MSKGSHRRPTLNKELAEKNWDAFESQRKARQKHTKNKTNRR